MSGWGTWGPSTPIQGPAEPLMAEPAGGWVVSRFVMGGKTPQCFVCGWWAPSGDVPTLARHSATHSGEVVDVTDTLVQRHPGIGPSPFVVRDEA